MNEQIPQEWTMSFESDLIAKVAIICPLVHLDGTFFVQEKDLNFIPC